MASDAHRLPTNVVATHYDLTICTDLEKLRFYGSATVHLDVVAETPSIEFHSFGLTLHDLTITSSALTESQSYTGSAVQLNKDNERATVSLASSLPAGSSAQLKLGFEAELTGSMIGYYRSSWKDGDTTKYYALTQFEPTAARRAFPCWDEPALKSTFTVTLISRVGTTSLANMPSISEDMYTPNTAIDVPWLNQKLAELSKKDEKQWKITKFEKTPPMSTYIVAFANGVFEYKESAYKSPLSGKTRVLRVYATSDLINQVQWSLDVKEKIVPLYERVFDIEYPLPKLDTLIAHDFDAGAMENWGLITGRAAAFCVDPKKTSIRVKKQIAGIMSHEVAHMWFGNITTMQWWDYLYLNEGFASLMGEVVILDKVFPEWRVHSVFVSGHLARALKADANPSSHPIEVPCPDANMVNQIFDGLSYSKAASILRMLYQYAGDEKFMRGVSIYLKEHLFGNSVTEDLWKGIQSSTGLDIPHLMDNWVKKIGYPVVTVTEVEGGIQVRQDRFLDSGPVKPEDNETIWTIPLFVLTVSDKGEAIIDRQILLNEREKFIPLDTTKVFKVNTGTVGVYRVLYSDERLVKLAYEAVKHKSVLSLEDRMGLVLDAPAIAKAGLIQTSSALALIDAFRNETEFVVWTSIGETLSELTSVWGENDKVVELLRGFTRPLYAHLVERLGYNPVNGESVDDRELRINAITMAANAGEPGVIKELLARFAQFVESGDIDSDLERIIFKIAVENGGRAEFDKLRTAASNPTNPSQAISAILALGATRDEKLAAELFDTILDETRDQDVAYLLMGVASNSKFRVYGVKRFQENYDALEKRFDGNWTLQTIIRAVHSTVSTRESYTSVSEFFKTKDTSKYKMVLNQTLDAISAKASWVERSTNDILGWLETKGAKL
ncbi:peptidase family M1-domain-containing protein [Cristinia sonorae]|uniref:Aminopeptidase n=1 Tax=Cristinia sonorae TaxID=1940300 RepID=A0A8K0UUE2_9AGAR|nr:peptidase family M1-domain-containing protein [Cristinia sonorae]